MAAILVGSRDHRTQFWKRSIQGSFHQSLVAIGPVVSEERLKCEMLTDGRQTKSDDNSSHGLPGELKMALKYFSNRFLRWTCSAVADWQSSWISDLHKNEHFVEDHPMIIHSWFGFINQVIYCLWEKLFYSFSIGSKLLHPYIKTDLLRWPSCICSWHSYSCKILQGFSNYRFSCIC